MKFEIKYNIEQEKRIVIAMLTVTGDDDNNYGKSTATSLLYDTLKAAGAVAHQGTYAYLNLNYSGTLIPRKYIGIARCSDGDEFDEEFGKRLAKSRAYAKFYTKRERTMRNILKEINKFHSQTVSQITEIIDRESELRNSFAGKFNDENGGEYMPVEVEVK